MPVYSISRQLQAFRLRFLSVQGEKGFRACETRPKCCSLKQWQGPKCPELCVSHWWSLTASFTVKRRASCVEAQYARHADEATASNHDRKSSVLHASEAAWSPGWRPLPQV